MAFLKSFRNRKNTVKAIADRGWNPLNYNILTSLPLEKDVVNLTMVASKSEAVIHIPRLNIESGVRSYYIDHLIEEERRVREERTNSNTLRVSSEQSSRRLRT
jgi:hypothetical protein